MKTILLLADKEETELLSDWLEREDYKVKSETDLRNALILIKANKNIALSIIDIDSVKNAGYFEELCREIKSSPQYSGLPVVAITFRKNAEKIAAAINLGVDRFILKPFETEAFLDRLKVIFKELDMRAQNKKVLDLNYINYLVEVLEKAERRECFILAPVIINKLVLEKIKDIVGSPIIGQLIKRTGEIIGQDHPFMKEIKYVDGQLSLAEVDRASSETAGGLLAIAFRDYVFAFLQILQKLTSNILMGRDGE